MWRGSGARQLLTPMLFPELWSTVSVVSDLVDTVTPGACEPNRERMGKPRLALKEDSGGYDNSGNQDSRDAAALKRSTERWATSKRSGEEWAAVIFSGFTAGKASGLRTQEVQARSKQKKKKEARALKARETPTHPIQAASQKRSTSDDGEVLKKQHEKERGARL
ncbi:hypothetical protein DFP72DRAFT_1047666 [Ephemerocybe angulata]|uniref:Uncharacterized protein n=1 Tax=Ephemerocybe angulata TaxID=980116 RepID=A0A8H6M3F1_9AGAR|nr:hypothetical protein DFP72DRAFT_1047666 [Tulosesus angulatus]